MALMMGRLHHQWGPARSLHDQQSIPSCFWGLVASMWIGNCFLLVLNVPLGPHLAVRVQDQIIVRCFPAIFVLLLRRNLQRR